MNCNQRLGVVRMLENVIAPGSGQVLNAPGVTKNIQVTVDGTGVVAAQVIMEGTNNLDPRDWVTLNTIDVTGTDHAMSGALNTDAWGYVRCRVVSISGTNAKVNGHLVAL